MPEAYRVRNWKEYNEALVQRGSITLWFAEEVVQNWRAEKQSGVRGRPKKYSDCAIVCGLTLKVLFKLTFRMTEGFIKSVVKQLGVEIEAPDYTLLCKRQKSVQLPALSKRLKPGEGLALVVDSSGVKVYGEGEWRVRRYGWKKHRLWRKLHLAVNSETQQIEACELTELGVQDSEGFLRLLSGIPSQIQTVIGDGAYDRFSCYEACERRGIQLVAPAQHNARPSCERARNKRKASPGAVQKRDETIEQIRQWGRKAWKVQTGYHRRSLAETAVYRFKTLVGHRLSARTLAHQQTEAAIGCYIINKMTELGMPRTEKI